MPSNLPPIYPQPGYELEDRRCHWDRRREKRCQCGHGPLWHTRDGKCHGTQWDNGKPCECVEYAEQLDRRQKVQPIPLDEE